MWVLEDTLAVCMLERIQCYVGVSLKEGTVAVCMLERTRCYVGVREDTVALWLLGTCS